MSAYVEFKDVKKIYKTGEVEIHALRDVNFEIEKENSVSCWSVRSGKDNDSEYPGRNGHAVRRQCISGRKRNLRAEQAAAYGIQEI